MTYVVRLFDVDQATVAAVFSRTSGTGSCALLFFMDMVTPCELLSSPLLVFMDNGGGYAKYLHLYRKVAMISPCEPLFHHRRSVAIASIATPGVTYPRLHSTRSTPVRDKAPCEGTPKKGRRYSGCTWFSKSRDTASEVVMTTSVAFLSLSVLTTPALRSIMPF